jgi:hypothetical protein
LVRHDQFRDDYAGGGVDPVGARHGSYWLERVTVEAYEPVDETTTMSVLDIWAHQYSDLPQPLEQTLELGALNISGTDVVWKRRRATSL